MQDQEMSDLDNLPRLSSTLSACLRWRRSDLEELLQKQLEMIDTELRAMANPQQEQIA